MILISRMIVFLRCSTNNRASTAFDAFQSAVKKFGLSSRVCSDKGKEKTDVAWFMLSHPLRGPDRGNHITGRSVHNQRIERLWRDILGVYLFFTICFVIWKYAEFNTSQTSFIWLHSIMCSYPVLTETSPCLPRVTTGDHLVLSITNHQNNYGLEECCQIPLEEL